MGAYNSANQYGNSQFVVDAAGGSSFLTINDALLASVSGDTIYVRPGTYNESLIANMSGKSIIAAAVGTNSFEVMIVGNHIFDTDGGSVAFQSIDFSAVAGDCFTVGSAGALSSSAFFEGCRIEGLAGRGLVIASAAGKGSVGSFFTRITGSTIGAAISDGSLRLESARIEGATAALEISTKSSVITENMDIISPSGVGVLLTDSSARLNSTICQYITAGAAWSFTSNATVRTLQDVVESSNATGEFVESNGAYGVMEYATLILIGSAFNVDPQVTAIPLITISSGGIVTESIAASQTLESNHRYFCTGGALSLALPAMSTLGDVIIVHLRGGVSWEITQGAFQQIFIGNVSTTLGIGGSLKSLVTGDSVTLICSIAGTAWVAEASLGNLDVV